MKRHKTNIQVVVTSTETQNDKQGNKTEFKHNVRTVTSTTRVNDAEGTRATRTPNSNTSSVPPVRTPMSCTPRTTSSLTVTPRTPTSRGVDSETVTPRHGTPAGSSRTGMSKNARTPLPSANSKTPSTNTPRHGLPTAPFPKRFRKGEDPQKSEYGQNGASCLQRSKSFRDLEKKDDDRKRKEHVGVRRVLSSSTFNVPSPARVSGGRLSLETKSPMVSRSSFGRPSAKVSLGSSTPMADQNRRSTGRLGKSSKSLPDHTQPHIGFSNSLTPDVLRLGNSDMSISPGGGEEYFGQTESTAISVGVRIRPLSKREQSTMEPNVVDILGNNLKIVNDAGSSYNFNYDHCFWSCDEQDHPTHASQETVYSTIAQPLLEKAYEGYNACLFAYGQTGSGKSFTMLGDGTLDEPDMEIPSSVGIIPRFCRELFDRAKHIHSQNPPEHQLPHSIVEVEISYFEIYNERIYDLLSAGGGGGVGDHREALRVREHPENGPYVEGVARHLVSSYCDLQTWLLLGNKERSIAATGMNDKSSRSHAVFTIKLTQMMVEDVEGEQLESSKVSIINLVDLAGSERVAALQSHGDRLKEGVCINKSLLTLGKVITALAESAGRKRTFIPYRESVLTYLLKESLGGNSRTAMIATISPCKSHIEESLSTLRYAQQARKIVNHNYVNEDPTAKIIRSLKEEVERLRRQQLVRSPSILFDNEVMDIDEKEDADREEDDDAKKVLLEKEQEKDKAIMEKEAEIALLREQLRSQQHLSERNRNLEQRLKDNEARQQQALESQRLQGISGKDDNGPQLVNLCEDPHLSETLSYCIKEGKTTLGHSQSDLNLQGLHCEDIHCTIVNSKGQIIIHPRIDTDTYVNGKLIASPVQLHHSDRVVLSGIYYFRVNIPNCDKTSDTKCQDPMDFLASQQELLREQEKRLREEADAALAESRAELEKAMCEQRDQLMQDIYETSSQLRNKQELITDLEGKQWKLEEENRLLEEQLQKKQQTPHSLDQSFQSSTFRSSNILQEIEAVFDESVMEVRRDSALYAPPKLAFMIKEANQISKKLRKPYEFMVQEVLAESGVEIRVLVKDLRHQTTAKLTVNLFIEKLHILRDIVQGQENEDDSFETLLVWERTEDVSCVPGFINKLRDCVNSSMNCSFSTPNPVVSRSGSKRRRSSILLGSEKSSSTSSFGTVASPGGPLTVAAAIHESLAELPCPDVTSHPFQRTLEAISDLYDITQIIRNHITEPGSTLSDDEFSKQLIKLLCASQLAVSSLSSSGNTELENSCSTCSEIQTNFRRAPVKMKTYTSKIFQGIKNEVESLVDEEGQKLLSFSQSLISDISMLAIIASVPAPDNKKLKPGGPLCVSFTDGLKNGLESLLLKAADTSQHSAQILADMERCGSSTEIMETAQASMNNIAAFLRSFAKLNASVEYGVGVPEDDQRDIVTEWLMKVESAADIIFQLDATVADIGEHVEMPQALTSEVWRKLAMDLKKKLEALLCFAGLSDSHSESLQNGSFSSNQDTEDSELFMERLQKIASSSLQSVEMLIRLVSKRNSSTFDEIVSQDLRKRVLSHWPKNCDEYKMFLEKRRSDHQASPMKSSLRSSSLPREEKKVRFDISSDSMLEG